MVDAEFVKDVKKTPVVEFEIPKKIFLKNDTEPGAEDSLVVKLWDFNWEAGYLEVWVVGFCWNEIPKIILMKEHVAAGDRPPVKLSDLNPTGIENS